MTVSSGTDKFWVRVRDTCPEMRRAERGPETIDLVRRGEGDGMYTVFLVTIKVLK